MKKLVTALLSAAIMLAATPAASYAEGNPSERTTEVGGVTYTYTIEDSDPAGITIMSTSEIAGTLTIPAEIDGHRVIGIYDKAFLGQTNLEFVYLPDSLEYIGDLAFGGCTSMTQLVIPDNVTAIGDSAFMGCTDLFTASIGEGVTVIPEDCFFGCASLKEVTLPSKLKRIGTEAFYGCTELDTLIPESVTEIGFRALGYQPFEHTSSSTQVSGFIIGGKVGSYAETYAKENDMDFLDPDNYLAGDINKDGKVDAKDASAVLAEYARASTGAELKFTPWQRYVGDMKADQVIDANDASRILIEYARLSTLPDSSL